jgi:hypothetical protein
MVENWMKPSKNLNNKRSSNPFWNTKPIPKCKYRSGMPINLFGDRDRDGVMNVFDCQPNNPNKQGFVDALVGGVKGLFKTPPQGISRREEAKRGWKEGMAKPKKSVQAYSKLSAQQMVNYNKGFEKIRQRISAEQRQERIAKAKKVGSWIERKMAPMYYSAKTKKWSEQTPAQAIYRAKQEIVQRNVPQYKKTRELVTKKAVQQLFPGAIPMAAVRGTTSGSGTGKRGRPKGSVTYRDDYGRPIGVFQWRALQSAKRTAYKAKIRQMQIQQKMQRVPRYETQQYTPQQGQQVPPEVQGAVPEYSQFPGYEQQAQEQGQVVMQPEMPAPQPVYQGQPTYYAPAPEIAQEASRLPPAHNFPASSNKPYPAVPRTPIAPTSQTIPQGYVEVADSFTGRRYLKKLPQAENWIK